MIGAGLTDVAMLPQWVTHSGGERRQFLQDRIESLLSGAELAEWHRAVGQASAQGTFFISEPFHCAVGTKRSD
jgi:hypothetical protein